MSRLVSYYIFLRIHFALENIRILAKLPSRCHFISFHLSEMHFDLNRPWYFSFEGLIHQHWIVWARIAKDEDNDDDDDNDEGDNNDEGGDDGDGDDNDNGNDDDDGDDGDGDDNDNGNDDDDGDDDIYLGGWRTGSRGSSC